MQTPTVLELIHARLQDGSTPNNRKDPYKLAIAAEDGSMRWVVAAGLLSRLEAHGIFPDLIVGTSGGGLAATYFAAGQTRQGAMALRHMTARGYYRDGQSTKFIDPFRFARNQPAMDINGLIDVVFSECVTLNFAYLTHCPIPVYLTATQRDGEGLLQPLHAQSSAEHKLAMKNTARIPFLAHSARDANVLWDGGLSASIPLQQALDLGATHVLVVRCKGQNEAASLQISGIEKYVVRPALQAGGKDLLHLLNQRPIRHAEILAQLAQNHSHIHTLSLPSVTLNLAETREGRLFRQLVEAWHYAGVSLGLPSQPLPAEWKEPAGIYL